MKRVPLREKPDRKAIIKRLLYAACILAVCVAGAIFIGHYLDPGRGQDEPHGDLDTRFTAAPVIEYNGAQYTSKKNITSILLMGTDHYTDDTSAEDSYRNGGQADFLVLVVIDADSQTITPIQIDRDTIAEVTTLGVLGDKTGTRHTQICLAHGFGDGKEQSCVLQRDAVSRLLLDVSIPYYIAMRLDGIAALNDAAGGVTVTIADDFSHLDAQMQIGSTITLQGKQAEYFVRNRQDIGVGTNEARSKRQTQYWEAFVQKMDDQLHTESDSDYLHVFFKKIDSYLVMNLTNGRIINELWKDRDYTRESMVHPAGAYVVGEDGFMEFHADEAALKALVMRLFYDKVG